MSDRHARDSHSSEFQLLLRLNACRQMANEAPICISQNASVIVRSDRSTMGHNLSKIIHMYLCNAYCTDTCTDTCMHVRRINRNAVIKRAKFSSCIMRRTTGANDELQQRE